MNFLRKIFTIEVLKIELLKAAIRGLAENLNGVVCQIKSKKEFVKVKSIDHRPGFYLIFHCLFFARKSNSNELHASNIIQYVHV
jgi:hypothetical protein